MSKDGLLDTKPVPPLSYSSSNEILGCQQKYVYRKVLDIPKDKDAPRDTEALDVGSALHDCLENCMHDLNGFDIATLFKVMEKYGVHESKGPMLWTMLRKYKELHESVGAKCIQAEAELNNDHFIGFIDLLLEDKEGDLWITDLKTAASISRFLPSRLPLDRQLNLYVHNFNLTSDRKIKGCKYRVISKSRLKQKKNEGFREFSDRIYPGIEGVEYTVPIEVMNPKQAGKDFQALRKLQIALTRGNKKPVRNYQYCESYFRPCDYWSQCHGQEFTAEPQVRELRV